MKVTHINATGKKSELTLNEAVFGQEANLTLLSQALRVYQSNLRQGTSKVKTRSEVNRTKKKWFKQKGTGNARHGARTPNIFVGGGVSHGPNGEQNWSLSLNQHMKHRALQSALNLQSEKVFVHDGIVKLDGKTKSAVQALAAVATGTEKVLVILASADSMVLRSLRNIETVLVTQASRVTALEIALADKIVLTTEAVTALEDRLNKKANTAEVKPTRVEKVAKPVVKALKAEKVATVKKSAAKKVAKPAVKKAVAKPKAVAKATKVAKPTKKVAKA